MRRVAAIGVIVAASFGACAAEEPETREPTTTTEGVADTLPFAPTTAPPTTSPPTTAPPATAPPATTRATSPPATSPPATQGAYYANCDEARRAGAAPIRRGEPGYRSGLDRDNDGIACDT